MAAIRRYRVRFTDYGQEGSSIFITKTQEFRSLRAAGEFILRIKEDPKRDYQGIEAMQVEGLTDQEKAALAFFTDGKVDLR